jgi:hypothetical protein
MLLLHAIMAHRGYRYTYSYIHHSLNLDTRKEWLVNIKLQPLYPRKRVPVQIVQYAVGVSRDVRKYLDLTRGSNP